MKFFFPFFIIFTIALRPVLPLLNYAVNYDYIVNNLCEKRYSVESDCKGKCFVKKEFVKTENQSPIDQKIKIASIDVFIINEVVGFLNTDEDLFLKKVNPVSDNLHASHYFSRIFHPPLAWFLLN